MQGHFLKRFAQNQRLSLGSNATRQSDMSGAWENADGARFSPNLRTIPVSYGGANGPSTATASLYHRQTAR